jgi:hypothetical protein
VTGMGESPPPRWIWGKYNLYQVCGFIWDSISLVPNSLRVPVMGPLSKNSPTSPPQNLDIKKYPILRASPLPSVAPHSPNQQMQTDDCSHPTATVVSCCHDRRMYVHPWTAAVSLLSPACPKPDAPTATPPPDTPVTVSTTSRRHPVT